MSETIIGKLHVDRSFVMRIQKGDEAAVLALYDACFSPLMNVVVRYKNNREDQVSLINNAFKSGEKHCSVPIRHFLCFVDESDSTQRNHR